MPGKPTHKTQNIPGPTGNITQHTYELVLKRPDLGFAVSYMDFDDIAIRGMSLDQRFAGAREGFAQGVKFVDKNNTRSFLARLFEKITDPRRPDADEHFDKF